MCVVIFLYCCCFCVDVAGGVLLWLLFTCLFVFVFFYFVFLFACVMSFCCWCCCCFCSVAVATAVFVCCLFVFCCCCCRSCCCWKCRLRRNKGYLIFVLAIKIAVNKLYLQLIQFNNNSYMFQTTTNGFIQNFKYKYLFDELIDLILVNVFFFIFKILKNIFVQHNV